nr:recombinase family protein [Micrococcus sp. KBS0714]
MLAYVREGDTVVIKSPDRLARSTRDLLDLLSELKAKGVAVRFTDSPALDTASAEGAFMLTVLGAVAELERELTAERRREGIAAAKKAGKYERTPEADGRAGRPGPPAGRRRRAEVRGGRGPRCVPPDALYRAGGPGTVRRDRLRRAGARTDGGAGRNASRSPSVKGH